MSEPERMPAPPDVECPECGERLVHVTTEIASGAFRTQAASMPVMPIHYFDCRDCGTCWKLGQRLLPDPVRQTLRS
jgi:predicted nucleic acid-binding Zn ribbon protein